MDLHTTMDRSLLSVARLGLPIASCPFLKVRRLWREPSLSVFIRFNGQSAPSRPILVYSDITGSLYPFYLYLHQGSCVVRVLKVSLTSWSGESRPEESGLGGRFCVGGMRTFRLFDLTWCWERAFFFFLLKRKTVLSRALIFHSVLASLPSTQI